MRVIGFLLRSVLPTMNRALLELIGHRYGRYGMGILGSNRLTVLIRFPLPLLLSTCIPWFCACWKAELPHGCSLHGANLSRLYRTLVRAVPSCICGITSERSSKVRSQGSGDCRSVLIGTALAILLSGTGQIVCAQGFSGDVY